MNANKDRNYSLGEVIRFDDLKMMTYREISQIYGFVSCFFDATYMVIASLEWFFFFLFFFFPSDKNSNKNIEKFDPTLVIKLILPFQFSSEFHHSKCC